MSLRSNANKKPVGRPPGSVQGKLSIVYQMSLREMIDAPKILKELVGMLDDTETPPDLKVKISQTLLNKVLPDLKSVEMTVNPGDNSNLTPHELQVARRAILLDRMARATDVTKTVEVVDKPVETA